MLRTASGCTARPCRLCSNVSVIGIFFADLKWFRISHFGFSVYGWTRYCEYLNLEDDPLDSELVRTIIAKGGLAVEINRVDTLRGFRGSSGIALSGDGQEDDIQRSYPGRVRRAYSPSPPPARPWSTRSRR